MTQRFNQLIYLIKSLKPREVDFSKLKDSDLENVEFEALNQAILQQSALKKIIISPTLENIKVFNLLAVLFSEPISSLQTLEISNGYFTNNHQDNLFRGNFEQSTCLKEMFFINISYDSLRIPHALTSLKFFNMEMTAECIQNLSKLLRTNQTLKCLELCNDNINATNVKSLTKALKINTTLHTLNLSHNQIDSNGAICLSRLLEHNRSIQRLNLSNNKIGISGLNSFGKVLELNTSLYMLAFSGNNFEIVESLDNNLKEFSDGLGKTGTLKALDLSNNRFGDIESNWIKQGLITNHSLVFLSLQDARFDIKALSDFFRQKNPDASLKTLLITIEQRSLLKPIKVEPYAENFFKAQFTLTKIVVDNRYLQTRIKEKYLDRNSQIEACLEPFEIFRKTGKSDRCKRKTEEALYQLNRISQGNQGLFLATLKQLLSVLLEISLENTAISSAGFQTLCSISTGDLLETYANLILLTELGAMHLINPSTDFITASALFLLNERQKGEWSYCLGDEQYQKLQNKALGKLFNLENDDEIASYMQDKLLVNQSILLTLITEALLFSEKKGCADSSRVFKCFLKFQSLEYSTAIIVRFLLSDEYFFNALKEKYVGVTGLIVLDYHNICCTLIPLTSSLDFQKNLGKVPSPSLSKQAILRHIKNRLMISFKSDVIIERTDLLEKNEEPIDFQKKINEIEMKENESSNIEIEEIIVENKTIEIHESIHSLESSVIFEKKNSNIEIHYQENENESFTQPLIANSDIKPNGSETIQIGNHEKNETFAEISVQETESVLSKNSALKKLINDILTKETWSKRKRFSCLESRNKPTGIRELTQKLNRVSLTEEEALETVIKKAKKKHSRFFQPLHHFFRGRHGDTNELYRILGALNLSDERTIEELRSFNENWDSGLKIK